MKNPPAAALLVIGNEILNGTTQDLNVRQLALGLEEWGIVLREVRMILDERQAIIEAVLFYSKTYQYVFTSGGIGPTHDDITTASIAAAFDLPLHCHEKTLRIMEKRYGSELSEASKRMALIPRGATPIANEVSVTPGFVLRNIYVLAGVPAIFQAMLRSLLAGIEQAPRLHSRTLILATTESSIAEELGRLQARYEEVEIGSYPQLSKEGKYAVRLSFRGYAEETLEACRTEFARWLDQEGRIEIKE